MVQCPGQSVGNNPCMRYSLGRRELEINVVLQVPHVSNCLQYLGVFMLNFALDKISIRNAEVK